MSRHYSLDSIVVRGRRVFGWGFCLGADSPLKVGRLRVPLDGGGEFDLDVFPSGQRADLAAAFPEVPHAAAAGFMVNGLLPGPVARGVAGLVLVPSGEVLPLPGFPEAYVPATDLQVYEGWSRFREVARQRGWRQAVVAAVRGIRRRVRQVVQHDLSSAIVAARGAAVVLDHGMGGGANRYRHDRVATLRADGVTVVQIHGELSSLTYRLRLMSNALPEAWDLRLESQGAVSDFLSAISPKSIEVNNLVGFEDVPSILDRMLLLKQRDPALQLRFNLHDFHALCPSFTLINAAGRHCGVPSLDACRACLPSNARFSLGMNTGIDVETWREAWARFIKAADQRVAFSPSSLAILERGFPGMSETEWRIEPHRVDQGDFRPVAPRLGEPLNIVAVGHLNHAKGATLVATLAERAVERGLPLRFSVLGTLEGGVLTPAVRVTGPFEREDLCRRLEEEETAIAFLPSICPETYSYVTDELMATGLPIAVLDIGAPAERVAGYHSGLLLPLSGLDAQLDALLAFGRELRTRG